MLEGETFFAYLDDVYVVCSLDRVVPIFSLIECELWIHSRIEVHPEKTQVWNRGGIEPFGCHIFQQQCGAASTTKPLTSEVWKCLERHFEHGDFVNAQLRITTATHQEFSRTSQICSARLLPLFCAQTLHVLQLPSMMRICGVACNGSWVSPCPVHLGISRPSLSACQLGRRVGDDLQEASDIGRVHPGRLGTGPPFPSPPGRVAGP